MGRNNPEIKWEPFVGSDGLVVLGEHTGTLRKQPDLRMEASNYRWAVYVMGVRAREVVVQDHRYERYCRAENNPKITRLDYAKAMATAFASSIIQRTSS